MLRTAKVSPIHLVRVELSSHGNFCSICLSHIRGHSTLLVQLCSVVCFVCGTILWDMLQRYASFHGNPVAPLIVVFVIVTGLLILFTLFGALVVFAMHPLMIQIVGCQSFREINVLPILVHIFYGLTCYHCDCRCGGLSVLLAKCESTIQFVDEYNHSRSPKL